VGGKVVDHKSSRAAALTRAANFITKEVICGDYGDYGGLKRSRCGKQKRCNRKALAFQHSHNSNDWHSKGRTKLINQPAAIMIVPTTASGNCHGFSPRCSEAVKTTWQKQEVATALARSQQSKIIKIKRSNNQTASGNNDK